MIKKKEEEEDVSIRWKVEPDRELLVRTYSVLYTYNGFHLWSSD